MTRDKLDLLLVEDDESFRTAAAQWLVQKGHQVAQAPNGAEALHQAERKHFDVVVLDMNMPGMTGLEVLQRLKEASPDLAVIILTGEATIENAVAAMKIGAADYLTKPFPLHELERRCQMACERQTLARENRHLKTLLKTTRPQTAFIGNSTAMQEVQRLIDRVAPTGKAVLIQGESGTGKELVARAIQERSQRADQPFLTINCAALPENLVESELFGHEKGAFTGAATRKDGMFEVTDRGTLFIDEIGELPLGLQPKLLRILEDGSLRRVGSYQERRVDVRIIAATNRRLDQDVAAGRFREDLYYRINVMALALPPLRERAGDIPLLVQHFLGEGWEVEEDALEALVRYHWPGNVRQLKNVLDRASVLADERVVTMDDLPQEVVAVVPPQPLGTSAARSGTELDLAGVERAHVVAVLEKERGNKARAARALGIHRRKLYRLIERLGIAGSSPEQA
jgi:DNA-binding NtrC family response regulator